MRIVKLFSKLLNAGAFKSDAGVRSIAKPVSAEENWLMFKRYFGEDFWLITVDQNLINNKQTNFMSWCFIEYHFRKDQLVNELLPTPTVNTIFQTFEEKVDQAIAAIGGRTAATETGFGKRLVLYFSPSQKLENTLNDLTSELEQIPAHAVPTSSWALDGFVPDNLQRHLIENEKILAGLMKEGDDGNVAREVMHFITGVDAQQLPYIRIALQSQGYAIVEAERERIVFSKLCSPSSESIAAETKKLHEFCEVNACIYDGWETPVLR